MPDATPKRPHTDPAAIRFINRAFGREEIEGARLAFQARLCGIAVLMIGITLRVSGTALTYYLVVLALLGVSGWAFMKVSASARRWPGHWMTLARAGLILADMALITIALVQPGPGTPESWPDAMQLRVGNVGFLFAFLAFTALTYSPGLAFWSGIAAGASWLCGTGWVLAQPDSFTRGASAFAAMDMDAVIATLLDPNYVSMIKAAQDALLMAVTGGVIAVAVSRARAHAVNQIMQERNKAVLARYFSPDMATELMTRSTSLSDARSSRAAVLFADIFDFTTFAATRKPEETLSMLRDFHQRATREVFANSGTLNKFIGDEVMATFGAIHSVDKPATSAIRCAVGLARRIDIWSRERVASGAEPIRVGIGVHYGELVVGDIGDHRCLELAVIGDVVNVANRLQTRTRDLAASVLVSRATLDAAVAEGGTTDLIDGFGPFQALSLKGRDEPIEATVLAQPSPPA